MTGELTPEERRRQLEEAESRMDRALSDLWEPAHQMADALARFDRTKMYLDGGYGSVFEYAADRLKVSDEFVSAAISGVRGQELVDIFIDDILGDAMDMI